MTAQHLPQLNQYCNEGQVPKVNNQSRVKLIHLASLKILVWIFLDKASIIPAKHKGCWGPAPSRSLPRRCLQWEWGAGFTPAMCINALVKWITGANKSGRKAFALALIACSALGAHGLFLYEIFHYNINFGVKIMNVPFFLRLLRPFSTSKGDFLPLFRFQRFKIKRLEEKCFAMNYFSFMKSGGE